MITREPIHCSQIDFGQPLPWDLYGSTGELLLRKGYTIRGMQQRQQLHSRSLFVHVPAAAVEDAAMPECAPEPELPSVVRMLEQAVCGLDQLLHAMQADGRERSGELGALAALVCQACDLHAEVALMTILHGPADNYPVRHSVHAAIVALKLARALGCSEGEQQSILAAALAMNLGMLHYHAELGASDTALSARMKAIVRDHPRQGVQLLRRAGVTDEACLGFVLQHHESDDGSGYPGGVRGDDIVQGARIIALADRYCAAVSARRYQPHLLPHQALRDIFLEKRIDSRLMALSVRELGVYPVGTMVRLINGEIAVVIGKNPDAGVSTKPLVASLLGPRGVALPAPVRRDTSTPLQAIQAVLSVGSAGVSVVPQQIWGALAHEGGCYAAASSRPWEASSRIMRTVSMSAST